MCVSAMDVLDGTAGANVMQRTAGVLRALEFIAFLFLYHSILLLHEIFLLSSLLVSLLVVFCIFNIYGETEFKSLKNI